MKKKRLKIWVCEDDESCWKHQKKVILNRFPKAVVKFFENAGYASQATGSPDFILVDVGGAMGLGCDVASLTRYNVEGLVELHPGAIFIVFSAIGSYAEDTYVQLKSEIKAISRWVDGCSVHAICDVIKEYVD